MLTLADKPMSENGLRQYLAKALDKGFMREGFHSEIERADRNISDEDIRFGLERKDWTLKGPPQKSHSGGFMYLIKTVDVELKELCLLIKPLPRTGNFKVLTKY